MEKTDKLQKKLMEDFLKRHFKLHKIKSGKKSFKRVYMGYDDKVYYVSDEDQKANFKTHLTDLLGEVFGFKESIMKKVVDRFI
jgi:hypothetical protein